MDTSSEEHREVVAERRPATLWLSLLLVVAVALVYGRVTQNAFLNFDDDIIVHENPEVNGGLSAAGIAWGFTNAHDGNWVPLTYLTHMLDCELYGLDPAGHHATNLLLHLVSTLLLFAFARRVIGGLWPGFCVAALFGLHPIHVESVAWIAERKDTLSAVFWLLVCLAYLRYATRGGLGSYLLVLLFFVMGLMSKSMLVTLPCVLLLLDIWPLRQLELGWPRLVREKLPLFVGSAMISAITFVAQSRSGAVTSQELISFSARLSNTAYAYLAYLGKLLWPSDLAVFVPHRRDGIPLWESALSLLLLALLTAFVLRERRRRPHLFVGWCWYLGTLVPVIGLVQVGEQSLAFRYTYIPMIGIYLALVTEAAKQLSRRGWNRQAFGTLTAGLLVVGGIATWRHLRHWRDDVTLFTYALAVTEDNYVAHNNLGAHFIAHGDRYAEALPHFEEAVRIKPLYVDATENVGLCLVQLGRAAEAIPVLQLAIRMRAHRAQNHANLAQALNAVGRMDDAVTAAREAVRLEPENIDLLQILGGMYFLQGRRDLAREQYLRILERDPDHAPSHLNLGFCHQENGELEQAIARYERALAVEPTFEPAREALRKARALLQNGRE